MGGDAIIDRVEQKLVGHCLVQSLAFLRLMKSPTFSGGYFGGLLALWHVGRQPTTAS